MLSIMERVFKMSAPVHTPSYFFWPYTFECLRKLLPDFALSMAPARMTVEKFQRRLLRRIDRAEKIVASVTSIEGRDDINSVLAECAERRTSALVSKSSPREQKEEPAAPALQTFSPKSGRKRSSRCSSLPLYPVFNNQNRGAATRNNCKRARTQDDAQLPSNGASAAEQQLDNGCLVWTDDPVVDDFLLAAAERGDGGDVEAADASDDGDEDQCQGYGAQRQQQHQQARDKSSDADTETETEEEQEKEEEKKQETIPMYDCSSSSF